jgi:hypothetical protein
MDANPSSSLALVSGSFTLDKERMKPVMEGGHSCIMQFENDHGLP